MTKTSSCVNLAAGLAKAGKKVAVVDVDPQASLTISLGHPQPDRLPVTLSDMMGKVRRQINPKLQIDGILLAMESKIYFIREDDYLDHIDNKLEMYELLELVRAARADLEAGETARAVRTLCAYENQANEMYEEWCIPDEYAESGNPDDLAQFMEDELVPDDGEGVEAADVESEPAIFRLLRALDGMTDNAEAMLSAVSEIVG